MSRTLISVLKARKEIYASILLLVFIGESFTIDGQYSVPDDSRIMEEQARFIRLVQTIPADTSVSFPIIRNFQSQVDDIINVIDHIDTLTIIEKEKAKRSVVYFIKEINRRLFANKIHLYDLHNALRSYQRVLMTIFSQQPILPVMVPVAQANSEIIAAAFTQFKEHTVLDDIATYKRMSVASPGYILQFLETKPGFRFGDSLLVSAVANDPMNAIYYLRKNDPILKQRILTSSDSYVRHIAALSNEKNARELTTFARQLSEGKITAEEIIFTRTEPARYFQLLVNTMVESKMSSPSTPVTVLQKAIREKALTFYVKPVNDLHNATETVRFASVNGLRAPDLYFIITNCGDELYTSSYLGLYKRLVASFNDQPLDSLFEMVQWENFAVFLRMAANYNMLDDFLYRLSRERMREVLRFFVGNIENDANTALEKAMDIADFFGALNATPETRDLVHAGIQVELERCIAERHPLGIRLYSILNEIIKLTNEQDGLKDLWLILGDYETLKRIALLDARGKISELVLFYGDEDGVSSFSNFFRNYSDKSKWQIYKNEYWVSIRSVLDSNLTIYANRPLEIEKQYDLAAQDSLFVFLKTNEIFPSILVHRGHSYHLEKTLNRLMPSVKLSILGSCGGYNKAMSIASINADVQVIGSKKTGSKAVNDPILDIINDELSGGHDIYWPEIWAKLGARFKKDEGTLSMFNEYFAPSHNLGLFVLKLYQANRQIR